MAYKEYSNFVFLSPGPVGDHLVTVDFANHFFEATSIPSVILVKHPNQFLRDLSIPYDDHITYIGFAKIRGFLRVLLLTLQSIFQKNCYILIFPVPLPPYLRMFCHFIRYCTRSRVVGFNHEGTKFFPIGSGYASVLGQENCIPLLAEPFYKSADEMLTFLGYKATGRVPRLAYIPKENILSDLGLQKGAYIVMHIIPSYKFRSLPPDRWNNIISSIIKELPTTKIVFSGAKNDINFIESCIVGLPQDTIVIAAGKTDTQELLTLYAHAKVNVTVQTGNGLIINMLHVKTVVVNIKGTAMFYYDFNENAAILFSKKDCICDPFRTSCNFIQYKGGEYMACIFNISDQEVVDAVLTKYNTHTL
jgi:hypothetical protein